MSFWLIELLEGWIMFSGHLDLTAPFLLISFFYKLNDNWLTEHINSQRMLLDLWSTRQMNESLTEKIQCQNQKKLGYNKVNKLVHTSRRQIDHDRDVSKDPLYKNINSGFFCAKDVQAINVNLFTSM